MFSPHLAEIKIKRSDPNLINTVHEEERIKTLFARIAKEVVLKDILHAPKDKNEVRKAKLKIKREHEFYERLKFCKKFLKIWNKWRLFYFDLPEYVPKNAGQLTMIENAIAFSKENNLDLNMLIACVHRSFKKRFIKPSFKNLFDEKAVEIYDQFYDQVLGDLDREESISIASRGIVND